MVIHHDKYVAKENIQAVTLLYSKAFYTETNVYFHCDNCHAWTSLPYDLPRDFCVQPRIE